MPARFIITIVTVFFLVVCVSSYSPAPEEGLSVTITNLRNNKGHVLISLFREGAGFPGDPGKAFRKEKITITRQKASIHFQGIPAGYYAIAILHDENDDTKMNTNWLGLPREGYGFSNNAMGVLGPPSYEKASFKHIDGQLTAVRIRTKY